MKKYINLIFILFFITCINIYIVYGADTKVSNLTELATTPADSDEFYVNDGGVSKKIQYTNLLGNSAQTDENETITGAWAWPDGEYMYFGTGDDFQLGTSNGVALILSSDTASDLSFQLNNDGSGVMHFLTEGHAYITEYLLSNECLYLGERAAASTDFGAFGQFWVENTDPNVPRFTNGDGTDFNLFTPEGSNVLSTGESGGTKFLREDGDGTCSWQSVAGSGTVTTIKENDSQVGGADITILDFLGADFDLAESPDTEIQIIINSGVTRDTEWNTAAKINTATTDEDFLVESDIGTTVQADLGDTHDTAAELDALYQSADAFLADIAALTDPSADRIAFWDDSAGDIVWLSAGAGLTITGTEMTASASATAWDDLGDSDANSEVSLSTYTNEIALGASGTLQIGDGGDNHVKFLNDSGTIKMSFEGNAELNTSEITLVDEGIFGQTGTSDADYFSLAAYDLDGTAYQTLLRPVASNTPHLELGPVTNFVKISQAGVVTFEGTSDIDLPADSVDNADIGDDQIDSEHYVAGSIDNEHLADDAVGVDELATDAVTMDAVDADGDFTSLTGDWKTTGYVSGQANTLTDTSGAIVITVNAVNYGTDTGDADIPDGACDAAGDVGNWVVLISSAADAYSLTSNDASNQFIIAANAAALDAGNELDVDGTMVCVMCIAAELWKVTGYMGSIPTDGGAAD